MARQTVEQDEGMDPVTGEVSPKTINGNGEGREVVPVMVDMTMAAALAKAELDQQVVTAKQYPRSVQRAVEDIIGLATLNDVVAQSCIYSLPRAGKAIVGPSIRLAEIVGQCWGNCVVDAVVIGIDRVNKMITAAGMFHDLQTNVRTRTTVSRRISDSKGRIYSDDMIAVTGNAACAIARRNAILAGVPKGIWGQAYEAAHKAVAGTVMTLEENRRKALAALEGLGAKPAQIFAALKVKGEQDIGLDGLVALRGMYSALKNDEVTLDEMFDPRAGGGAVEEVVDPLKDKPPAPDKPVAAKAKSKATEAKAVPEKPAAKSDKIETGPSPGSGAHSQAALIEAHQRGAEARKRGMQRKAVPPEYREREAGALAKAWLDGWDAGA